MGNTGMAQVRGSWEAVQCLPRWSRSSRSPILSACLIGLWKPLTCLWGYSSKTYFSMKFSGMNLNPEHLPLLSSLSEMHMLFKTQRIFRGGWSNWDAKAATVWLCLNHNPGSELSHDMLGPMSTCPEPLQPPSEIREKYSLSPVCKIISLHTPHTNWEVILSPPVEKKPLILAWKFQTISQEKHSTGQGSVSKDLGVTSLSGSKEAWYRLPWAWTAAPSSTCPDNCVYLLISSFETDTLLNLQGSRRTLAFTTLWKIYPIVSHEGSSTTANMIYLPGLMKTNKLWYNFKSQDKNLPGWAGEGEHNHLYHPHSHGQLHS